MIKRFDQKEKRMTESCESGLEYLSAEKPSFGEKLTRNLALAGMLIISLSAVRNAKLPAGQTVLAAVKSMVETDWDQNLGKISFVGNFFPESVSVFFQSSTDASLTAPCFGNITHAWSKDEPYLGYWSKNEEVYAMADGQVMSIAHGNDEEKIVRILHDNGLECLYYDLALLHVQEGDRVTENTCIGKRMTGKQAIVDVRREGLSIDPTLLLQERTAL